MMDDLQEREKASTLVTSLLNRQQQMSQASDPFSLMKELTSTFDNRPSQMQVSAYDAYTSKVGGQGANPNVGTDNSNFSPSKAYNPISATTRGNIVGNPAVFTNLSGIIKNKDLFMKAQRRAAVEKQQTVKDKNVEQQNKVVDEPAYNYATKKPDDFFSQMQESKEKFLKIGAERLPELDHTGAFEKMLTAKKANQTQQSTIKKASGQQFKLSKQDEIQIGLEMIPMYQAKEEELTQKHSKLKGLREEIEGYMDEQGIRLKYVQPQITTSFMNRKLPQTNSNNLSNAQTTPVSAKAENSTTHISNQQVATIKRSVSPSRLQHGNHNNQAGSEFGSRTKSISLGRMGIQSKDQTPLSSSREALSKVKLQNQSALSSQNNSNLRKDTLTSQPQHQKAQVQQNQQDLTDKASHISEDKNESRCSLIDQSQNPSSNQADDPQTHHPQIDKESSTDQQKRAETTDLALGSLLLQQSNTQNLGSVLENIRQSAATNQKQTHSTVPQVKMPPVSQGIAKRKQRKMLQNEDLNFNNLVGNDPKQRKAALGGNGIAAFGNSTATQGFYSTKSSSFYNKHHAKNTNKSSLLMTNHYNSNKFAAPQSTTSTNQHQQEQVGGSFVDTRTVVVGGAEVSRMSVTQDKFMDVKEQNSSANKKTTNQAAIMPSSLQSQTGHALGGPQDDKSSLTMGLNSTNTAAEVTSRLYNKKMISKMRQKSQQNKLNGASSASRKRIQNSVNSMILRDESSVMPYLVDQLPGGALDQQMSKTRTSAFIPLIPKELYSGKEAPFLQRPSLSNERAGKGELMQLLNKQRRRKNATLNLGSTSNQNATQQQTAAMAGKDQIGGRKQIGSQGGTADAIVANQDLLLERKNGRKLHHSKPSQVAATTVERLNKTTTNANDFTISDLPLMNDSQSNNLHNSNKNSLQRKNLNNIGHQNNLSSRKTSEDNNLVFINHKGLIDRSPKPIVRKAAQSNPQNQFKDSHIAAALQIDQRETPKIIESGEGEHENWKNNQIGKTGSVKVQLTTQTNQHNANKERQARSSSVTNKINLYSSFQKEPSSTTNKRDSKFSVMAAGSSTNPHNINNGLRNSTHNFTTNKTQGTNRGDGRVNVGNSGANNVGSNARNIKNLMEKSRNASSVRLSKDNLDFNNGARNNKMKYSSRANLKELIFVDHKNYVKDLGKKNSRQKLPMMMTKSPKCDLIQQHSGDLVVLQEKASAVSGCVTGRGDLSPHKQMLQQQMLDKKPQFVSPERNLNQLTNQLATTAQQQQQQSQSPQILSNRSQHQVQQMRAKNLQKARLEHIETLQEIKQINKSLSPNKEKDVQKSMTRDQSPETCRFGPEINNASLEVSMKGKGTLDTERNSGIQTDIKKVELLQSNIAKLEKIEKRLMKGRQKKQTIQSGGTVENTLNSENTLKEKGERKKSKKGKKNWRFAYDLYCKELMQSGQKPPQLLNNQDLSITNDIALVQQFNSQMNATGSNIKAEMKKSLQGIPEQSRVSSQQNQRESRVNSQATQHRRKIGSKNGIISPKNCKEQASLLPESDSRRLNTMSGQSTSRQYKRSLKNSKNASKVRMSATNQNAELTLGQISIGSDCEDEMPGTRATLNYPTAPNQPVLCKMEGQDTIEVPKDLLENSEKNAFVALAKKSTQNMPPNQQQQSNNFETIDGQTIDNNFEEIQQASISDRDLASNPANEAAIFSDRMLVQQRRKLVKKSRRNSAEKVKREGIASGNTSKRKNQSRSNKRQLISNFGILNGQELEQHLKDTYCKNQNYSMAQQSLLASPKSKNVDKKIRMHKFDGKYPHVPISPQNSSQIAMGQTQSTKIGNGIFQS